MIQLIYPAEKPRIRTIKGQEFIFCTIRKRWLVITPEEWVRQNFILYLINILGYPAALISVEKQLVIGGLKKRFDIAVYKNDKPFMIVECKQMDVPLSSATILQVLNYNSMLQAVLLVVTNGNFCAAFKKEAGSFSAIEKLPASMEL